MDKFIITSCDDNPNYYFFLPIIIDQWKEIGYKVNFWCINGGSEAQKFVIETATKNGGLGILIDKNYWQQRVLPFNYSAVTAALRLIPLFENIIGDQFCLTSDIDMMPLNKEWFNPMNICRYQIYGENPPGYGNTRYPICYLGMSKQDWLAIVTDHQYQRNPKETNFEMIVIYILSQFDQKMPQHLQFSMDELYIHNKLNQQPDFNDRKIFTGRDMINNPGYKEGMTGVPGILPVGRIDRSNLPDDLSNIDKNSIDLHCPRPGYTNDNWNKIIEILSQFYDEKLINKWKDYRNEFVSKLVPLEPKEELNPLPIKELSSNI